MNKKDILFFNKKLKYTFHKSTPTTQFVQRVQLSSEETVQWHKWGSPIPFPTGGACVLSVIRFQDGGRRSAGGQCRSSNMIYYAGMHRQTFEKLT